MAMLTNQILAYLKAHGESLDSVIAKAVGLKLANTRNLLLEMTNSGMLVSCQSTKFEKGVKIQGMQCRVSGFIPPAAPGRKSAKV